MSNTKHVDQAMNSIVMSAVSVAVDVGAVSTALLQRRLTIGHDLAKALVDDFVAAGILDNNTGDAPKKVLINDPNEALRLLRGN